MKKAVTNAVAHDEILSARRASRRPVHVATVGMARRLMATLIDAVLPSAGLFLMIWGDVLTLPFLTPEPGRYLQDHVLHQLFTTPALFVFAPLYWMLNWTAVGLICLGTVRTTLGKKLLGLRIRQRSGQLASGWRMFLRILAGWTVPLTLGLSYLWIWVNPERRGLHDILSGTFVVRDLSKPKIRTLSPLPPAVESE